MNKLPKQTWKDFFKDSRGNFTVYSVVSLLAGLTIVTAPLITRIFKWQLLTRDETVSLVFIYCIVALSDSLLAIFINKMPSMLKVDTANVDINTEAVEEPIEDPTTTENQENVNA